MWLQRWWQWISQPDPDSDVEAIVRDLRLRALTVPAAQVGLAPSALRADVWGALIETGYPEAVVTLAALGDGSTSVYLSTGGGVVGAGGYSDVSLATEHLLSVADGHVAAFAPTANYPMPQPGRVRIYLRTFSGTRVAEAAEGEITAADHPLAEIHAAGQQVMAAVRLAEQRHATRSASGATTVLGGGTLSTRLPFALPATPAQPPRM